MTNNTTLDAAIEAGTNVKLELQENASWHLSDQEFSRTYARALIAKLIEGMEPPAWFSVEEDSGFDFALTEIRRRAGLEQDT
jgi:hypothetical protein